MAARWREESAGDHASDEGGLAEQAASRLRVEPLDTHNCALLNHVAPLDWTPPTPHDVYDLVAIGAGAGGLISAKQAARRGAKSALVEKHLAGGDCLNVGCVPSKALLRSARALKEVRRSAELGVEIGGPVSLDFGAVMARMRRLRAQIAPADSYAATAATGAHMFAGRAEFTSPHTLRITPTHGGEPPIELRFRTAVVAAGGRPNVPPAVASLPYVTNETLFNLTSLPPRIVVLGGGPIGLEMAQAFAVFGARVTVVARGPKLLPREDKDAAALVAAALARDGVEVVVQAELTRACETGAITTAADGSGRFHELELDFQISDGRALRAQCDLLLVATGRVPNVEGLGLEAAGVAYDARAGIRVDDSLRTSARHIFAVGDVCSRFQFTHMSGEMAKGAVDNALFASDWSLAAFVVPWVTYTMPEVAHVGAYERDLDASGVAYDTFRAELEHNDRAILDGEAEGFVKLTCAKGTPTILGCTIVGAHAGDLLAEVTLAIKEGVGIDRLARSIHPYPTVGESVMGAALNHIRAHWQTM